MRVLLISVFAAAGAAAQPSPATLAVTHAHVVDVRSGNVTPDVTIFVRDGTIVSVGRNPVAAGVPVVDLAGRYVVPGLIDAHVHIQSLDAARRALESGVTTVRMAGASYFVDVAMRELARSGAIAGPDVVASGLFVRHAPPPDALLSDPSLAALRADGDRAENLQAVVRANLARDVQVIKIAVTERAGLPGTDPRQQTYTEPEIRAVVDAAATKGVPVEAHAHGDEGAAAAVRAGVRSIEHGTYLSEGTLVEMKARGVFLVPTYTIVTDLAEPGGDYDDPVLIIRSKHMLPRLETTIRNAHRIGVRLVTGTDTSYGPNSLARIAQEIQHLVRLGLSPLEALRAATISAADLLGLADRTGAIEVGLDADLLVVDGNPLDDPVVLQDPLVVISNGRVALDRRPALSTGH